MMITILAQGIIIQNQISELSNPSMAAVMGHVVGKWGAAVINIGLIISVMGAWLGWSLLAAEVPYLAAKDDIFPAWFGKDNENHAPVNSMLMTSLIVQLFFFTLLFTDKAYNFAFSLASSAALLPYAFSAFYQVKFSRQRSRKQMLIGSVASVYTIWLVYAAGLEYLLLTMILYFPGIFMYRHVQKLHGRFITKLDKILFGVITLLALIGIYFIITGQISGF